MKSNEKGLNSGLKDPDAYVNAYSYEEIANILFGKWALIINNLCILFYLFSCQCSYMTLIKVISPHDQLGVSGDSSQTSQGHGRTFLWPVLVRFNLIFRKRCHQLSKVWVDCGAVRTLNLTGTQVCSPLEIFYFWLFFVLSWFHLDLQNELIFLDSLLLLECSLWCHLVSQKERWCWAKPAVIFIKLKVGGLFSQKYEPNYII